MTHSRFESNEVLGFGGALHVVTSSLGIKNSTFVLKPKMFLRVSTKLAS